MPTDQIALQLYTLRAETARDMLATLAHVVEIGYRAVEFAGYGGVPVPELRAALDRLGLRAVAAHVPLADLENRLPAVLDELAQLGCGHAVLPSVPETRRADLAAARRLAADLDRIGAACRAAGLVFAYHNHAFEFAPLPGADGDAPQTLYDVLIRETDPTAVAFELDLYWAAYAGTDPLALLPTLAGRVPLVHLKDLGPAPDRPDLPVGDGALPWSDLLPAATAAGAAWQIVEQDHPREGFLDVERSLRNLERMT